jgi:putative component of membrane protein insertase Oxa1/YidC/SpoIIIJ protein YidD
MLRCFEILIIIIYQENESSSPSRLCGCKYLACCSVAIAVVESNTGVVKGLLASKSRISKRDTSIPSLELISGHMSANMTRNLTAYQVRDHMDG